MSGDYRCFNGCGKTFDSLDEMEAVPGADGRSPRHFCEGCASRIRRGPPLVTDGGTPAEGTRHEDHETEVYGQFHACKDCKVVIEYV